MPRRKNDFCCGKMLGYYFPPFLMNPCPVFDVGCNTGFGVLVAHLTDAKIHIYQGPRHSKCLGRKTFVHENADRSAHSQRFGKQGKNHLATVEPTGGNHLQIVYVSLKTLDLRADLTGGRCSNFSGHTESNHATPDSHAATCLPRFRDRGT